MLAGHRPGGQPQPPAGFAQIVVHMRHHAVGRGSGARGADDGRPAASYSWGPGPGLRPQLGPASSSCATLALRRASLFPRFHRDYCLEDDTGVTAAAAAAADADIILPLPPPPPSPQCAGRND
eukprot:SAG25_NODE_908_length_4802_cov_2.234106_1_plen_123_part_00